MDVKALVGTSGFVYDDWRGRFYPEKLPRHKWLEYYSEQFHTIELNNSFYRLPSESAFQRWHDVTPSDFTFALKVSRFITHIKRLKNTEEAVDTFISKARILGEKLGPLLYQLPPSLHRDDDILESFLSTLPSGLQHVIEFRHHSWFEDEVFEILRRYATGFCIFDMPDLTCPLVATADFAYVRFHGSTGLYYSCYSEDEMDNWAKKLAQLPDSVRHLYIYFNNDAQAFAVSNACTIHSKLQSIEKE